ncbi:MAG: protein translocase subunit SecD [Dehalococcoidia bacterium]|nr:protein translocase subunit SecD [Dehalococcoidia bacterium]
MFKRHFISLFFTIFISIFSAYLFLPNATPNFLPNSIQESIIWPESAGGLSIGNFQRDSMRLGLDLQGGTRLLLKAIFPEEFEGDSNSVLEGTIQVLRKRVDGAGVAEAEITRQDQDMISIQLPGLNTEEARNLLGRTARLKFCEPIAIAPFQSEPCDENGEFVQAYGEVDGKIIAMSGSLLKPNAFVGTDTLGNPAVGFEWQNDGPEISKQVTTRLIGQRLAIFLDDEVLSAPTVNATIIKQGQITGLGLERARQLVIQLNSGSLPVDLQILSEQSVDATLGQDSIDKSLVAGQLGLMLVCFFMLLYYGLLGGVSVIALLVYSLLTLALFKLIPITLTLAGIGAFVLSVGMAVDANILIFERMKEELRSGRSYVSSLEIGFGRAWPSIRDSNATTLITCLILYSLGGGIALPGMGSFSAPLVQGFAITLAIGVLISMYTAVFFTKSMLYFLGKYQRFRRFVGEEV